MSEILTATIIGSIGAIIAGIGLIINGLSYNKNTNAQKRNALASEAQFWLQLSSMFVKHDGIHRKLRPEGNGSTHEDDHLQEDEEKFDDNDKANIEAYLGLFQHVYRMLKTQIIDLQTFESIYAYRIKNLLAHKWIINNKLNEKTNDYLDFLYLLKMLKLEKCKNKTCYHYKHRHNDNGQCEGSTTNGQRCTCSNFSPFVYSVETMD